MAECPLKDLDDKNSDRNNFEISHILPSALRKINRAERLRISDDGVSKLLSSEQVDRAKDNAQWLSELAEDDFLSLLKEAYRGNIKEASPGYRKILKEVEQDNVKENSRGRGASMSLSGRAHDSCRADEIESSGPGRKSRGGSKDKLYEHLPGSKRVRQVEKSNSDVGVNQKLELVDIKTVRNVKSSENINTSEKESETLKLQTIDRPNHEKLIDFTRGTPKCKNKSRNQSNISANQFPLEDTNKVVNSQSSRNNKNSCHNIDIYDKPMRTSQGSLREKNSGDSKFAIEDKYYVDNEKNVIFESKHKNDFLHSSKLNAKFEDSHCKKNLGAIQKARCFSKTVKDDVIYRTEEVSYNDCSHTTTPYLENSIRHEKNGDKSTKKRFGPMKLNDKKQCEFSETSSKSINKYDSQSITDVDTMVTFPLRPSEKCDKSTSGKLSNSPRSSSTVRSSSTGARDSPESWQNHNVQRKSEGSDLSISPNGSELHSSSTTSAPERPDEVEHSEDVIEESRKFSTYQFKEACKQLHPLLNSNHGCGYEIEMNCLDDLKFKQKRKTTPDNVNEKSLSVENHSHVEKLLVNQTNSNYDGTFETIKFNEGAMNKNVVIDVASKNFATDNTNNSKSSSSNNPKTLSIPNNKLTKKKRIAPVIFLDHYKPKLLQKDFTFGFEVNDELLKLGPEKYRSMSLVNNENNLCRSSLQLEDPSVLLSSSSQGHIAPTDHSMVNNNIKNKTANDKEKTNLENATIDDALGNFNYMEVISYVGKSWGDVALESEDSKMKVGFYSSD